MPVATCANPSTPVSTVSSLAPSSMNAAPAHSGPYTKAQFQSTMEGSRTIKSSKEVEYLLRDYPAALELFRTGKYKVKVKSDAEVERVILVEKRITKVAASALPAPSTATAEENQENNQTVPDVLNNSEETKEVKTNEAERRSRSRTHSRDRIAPTSGNTIVHTTISSIRMTSNTQPKVDHHRTPSRERDVSVTPPQQQHYHGRSQSRDSQHRGTYGKQINREYPKMMVPFIPKPNNLVNLWQQPRAQQPYFSNPMIQQQQKRSSLYLPPTFVPQQNPLYRQPYFYGQRPAVFPQQQAAFPPPTAKSVGKSALYPPNNFASSSRSVSNSMGLPPSFRTFHSNQQPLKPFQPMYPTQMPFPMNHPWAKFSNEPISALTGNNKGPRNHPSVRSSNGQPQAMVVVEQNQRPRPQPLTNAPASTENEKEPAAPSKEQPSAVNGEKLTVRQLNESFLKADPSGRVPYSSLPNIIERFGINLTENDVVSAAKDLEYNVNDPISARRFIHVLVKLGKITKSTQQQQPQPQRPPGSPSMLPEDREVTDIMTQRKATANQPNQWH